MPNLVSISRVKSVLTAAFVIFTGGLLLASNSSSLLAENAQTADEAQEDQRAFLPYLERVLPFDQWPECPPEQHDPNEWHSLVDRESQCHYNHEHKDDPHLLDDVFGTQVYEWAGGSVSYPWQTGDGHGENEHKHETYGWIVLRDMPPEASESEDGIVSGTDTGFIKHFRMQGHFDLHAMGAPTRFHSAYIEVMVCYKARPDDCGIARFGGHVDYGELRVDGNWIPLPDDPDEYDGVDPPAVPEKDYDNLIDKRAHSTEDNRVGWIGRFIHFGGEVTPVSYAGPNHRTMDAFGPINPDNIHEVILTDPAVYNNSTHGLDFFVMRMRDWMADENGRINWFGYATRYGLEANPACTEPGLDCVPVSFENVPAMRGIFIQPREIKEYDTSPPGVSWIEYPN
jgi:hypothetical protein